MVIQVKQAGEYKFEPAVKFEGNEKKIESPSLHVVEKKEALNVAISDENPKASEEVVKKEISEK